MSKAKEDSLSYTQQPQFTKEGLIVPTEDLITMSSFLKSNPSNGMPMSSSVSKGRKRKDFEESILSLKETKVSLPEEKIKTKEQNKQQVLEEDDDEQIAPRVTIVGGRLVIDEESLLIARGPQENIHRERIEETGHRVTSASFKKTTPRDRWDESSTRLFYEALSIFGTDFGLMTKLIPGKTREQIKNKFKKEEKTNGLKVKDFLNKKP